MRPLLRACPGSPIRGWLLIATLVGPIGVATPLAAQTFQGRVVEDPSEQPVSAALIRLVDSAGEQLALTIADSAGLYRIEAPAPGIYRIEAARLGYRNFESPLLDASVADGVYPIDLLMVAAPVELPGFTVETRRLTEEEADRQTRLIVGLSPESMRYRPIDYETIQDHVARAHSLVDVMRWSNNSALIVSRTTDGPCFSVRGRGCLPVYMNGMELHRDFVEGMPLEMVERIVIVTPTDGSMAYPAGGVLLFTEAWLR